MISKIEYNLYFFGVSFVYISYILILFGITVIDLKYLHYLVIITHVLVCFFLFKRFNIFNNDTLIINQYEKNIIFSGAFLLFINTVIYEIGFQVDINKLRSYMPFQFTQTNYELL